MPDCSLLGTGFQRILYGVPSLDEGPGVSLSHTCKKKGAFIVFVFKMIPFLGGLFLVTHAAVSIFTLQYLCNPVRHLKMVF